MPPARLLLLPCFIPRFAHFSLLSAHSFLIAPLLPALRFPLFLPLLAPLFSDSSSLSPLPFHQPLLALLPFPVPRPPSLPFPLSLLTSLTSHLPTTHFSALCPLPFLPVSLLSALSFPSPPPLTSHFTELTPSTAPAQPRPSSPTRQKKPPKRSHAPSPPTNFRHQPPAPSPVRSPPPTRRAAQASPHRPGKTSPTRAAPRSLRRRPWPAARNFPLRSASCSLALWEGSEPAPDAIRG